MIQDESSNLSIARQDYLCRYDHCSGELIISCHQWFEMKLMHKFWVWFLPSLAMFTFTCKCEHSWRWQKYVVESYPEFCIIFKAGLRTLANNETSTIGNNFCKMLALGSSEKLL